MIFLTKTLYYKCVYLTEVYLLTSLKEMGYDNPNIIQKEKNYIVIRLNNKTTRTLQLDTYYVKGKSRDWTPYTKEKLEEEFEVVY